MRWLDAAYRTHYCIVTHMKYPLALREAEMILDGLPTSSLKALMSCVARPLRYLHEPASAALVARSPRASLNREVLNLFRSATVGSGKSAAA